MGRSVACAFLVGFLGLIGGAGVGALAGAAANEPIYLRNALCAIIGGGSGAVTGALIGLAGAVMEVVYSNRAVRDVMHRDRARPTRP